MRCCHGLVSRVASASSAVEAGCLGRSESDSRSKVNPMANRVCVHSVAAQWKFELEKKMVWTLHPPSELCLSLCECLAFSGKRWGRSHSSSQPWWSLTSQTLDTWSQRFINHIISTLSSLCCKCVKLKSMNLLSNKRHCLRSLWNLLGDQEEKHSLAQKSRNWHCALLTASCKKTQKNKTKQTQTNLVIQAHSNKWAKVHLVLSKLHYLLGLLSGRNTTVMIWGNSQGNPETKV